MVNVRHYSHEKYDKYKVKHRVYAHDFFPLAISGDETCNKAIIVQSFFIVLTKDRTSFFH